MSDYQTQTVPIVSPENVKVHNTRDESTDHPGQHLDKQHSSQQPNIPVGESAKKSSEKEDLPAAYQPKISEREFAKKSTQEEDLPAAYVSEKGSSALPIVNP